MGAINNTVSGNLASFKTASIEPINSIKLHFSPIQSGTGEPSPDNIRTISGRTSLTMTVCGTNILECTTFANNSASAAITYTGTRNSDGQITEVAVAGTATANNNFRNLNYVVDAGNLWPPDGAYATYGYSTQALIVAATGAGSIKDAEGIYPSNNTVGKWKHYNLIYDPSYQTTWLRIQVMPYNCKGVTINTVVKPLMCVEEDAGCEFEPFQGEKYISDFGSTYYGGYLDLISGELVKEWDTYTFNGSDAVARSGSIITINGNTMYQFYTPTALDYQSSNTQSVLFNYLPTVSILDMSGTCGSVNVSNRAILVHIEGLTTEQEYLNYFAAHPLQVVYPLATSTTAQLTPQPLNTRLGRNNIWSDARETVEVTYELYESIEMQMLREMMMAFDLDGGGHMKLIHSHTITQNYTTTLSPLYTAEIQPYITYGDYHKVCFVEFANNTSTASSPIRFLFFSLAIDITQVTSSTKTGGMIRGDYANVRDLALSNDARCNAGTVINIYELTFNS